MERQGTYVQIRLPKWMKDRFFAVTKRGERSDIIRRRIMEIIREREKEKDRTYGRYGVHPPYS